MQRVTMAAERPLFGCQRCEDRVLRHAAYYEAARPPDPPVDESEDWDWGDVQMFPQVPVARRGRTVAAGWSTLKARGVRMLRTWLTYVSLLSSS